MIPIGGIGRAASRLLVAVLLTVATAGATRGETSRIRIKGSDTMVLLVRQWAETFMAGHRGVAIEVEGGGSGKGTQALIAGSADIAAASRPLLPEESRRLMQHYGTLGYSVLTARDALSVYLHPSNPVHSLTLDQLKGIFTGSIRTWSGVGGTAADIQVLNRNPASGTRLFFREHVLGGEAYLRHARVLPTTAAIVDEVAGDPHAIGYGGIGRAAAGVRLCAVDGIVPSFEHVRDGSYPIARYLYLYTALPPAGRIKELIDWILGAEGQEVVTRAGYIPLRR